MSVPCNDQLLLDVFTALIAHWEAEDSEVEIGSDLEKIELLERINLALKNKSVVIPEPVLQLYSKVYLRDVWSN